MIKAKPLSLAHKLKSIVDICEAADAAIDEQNFIKKGALDTGKENDGIEPAVVRKILARRKKIAKDPAETTRLEDLMTDYQFMLGEGREDTRPWTQTDDEISRVMALTNTSKPPKIEAIKKALGCSQGKAHKLRSIVAVRLAKKSSSSSTPREHEHLPAHDPATGEVIESLAADEASAVPEATDQPLQAAPPAIDSRAAKASDVESPQGPLTAPDLADAAGGVDTPALTTSDEHSTTAAREKGAPQVPAGEDASNTGGDHDAGRLNPPVAEVARAAPLVIPAEAPQKVGAGDPRPEGTPTAAVIDDLAIPSFLDRRLSSPRGEG